MLNEDVKRAVEAVRVSSVAWPHFTALTAHLEAQEAEIAKCRRSVEHTHQWYAVRFERLKHFAKERFWWPEMAAIIANGSVSVFEPPTYAQQMNMLRHRAERAEALLRECHARLSTYHPADQRLANRITAHLSENSRG